MSPYIWNADYFKVEGFAPVPRLQVVTIAETPAQGERAVRLPALAAAAVGAAPRESTRAATADLFERPSWGGVSPRQLR